MMNGGSAPLVTPSPFSAPIAAPASIAATTASGQGRPSLSSVANSTEEQPRIDPTDRSMPPVRITNVIPMPRMPTIAICRDRL